MFCLQTCSPRAGVSSKEWFAWLGNSARLSWEFTGRNKGTEMFSEVLSVKQSEIPLEGEQRNVWNAESGGVLLKEINWRSVWRLVGPSTEAPTEVWPAGIPPGTELWFPRGCAASSTSLFVLSAQEFWHGGHKSPSGPWIDFRDSTSSFLLTSD